MIWSANSIREGRGKEVSGRLEFPKDAISAPPGSPLFIAPWTLETLTNEALCSETATGARTKITNTGSWATFSTFYNLVNDIEDAESLDDIEEGEIVDALPRVAWRQFSWQRGFKNSVRFYRSWYLYNFPEANTWMQEKYGISVERFSYVGFAVASQLMSFPAIRIDADLSQVGIQNSERDVFFSITSKPLGDARKQTTLLRKNRGQIAYKPSILRRYPLITIRNDGQIEAFCPLPPLLHLRNTDGLFYDLVGNDNLRRIVSQRFEKYVYELSEYYFSEHYVVLSESEYGPRSKRRATPDIILTNKGNTVHAIIECKARRIPFQVLSAAKPLQGNPDAFSEIKKAVIQIWRYASDLRREATGQPLRLSTFTVGVVLTLEPWIEMYPSAINAILDGAKIDCADVPEIEDCDQIPVAFVTIDDWEYTLRQVDAVGFVLSLKRHARPERAGFMLSHTAKEVSGSGRSSEPFDYDARLSATVPWWAEISERRIPE